MVELAAGLELEVDDPALLEDPEVLELLSKANESIEENPLYRYVPHERQLIFHQHRVKTKAFVGGNRSGKSTATVIDCGEIILPVTPPDELEATGARLILANTYHLWLRPGPDVVEEHMR